MVPIATKTSESALRGFQATSRHPLTGDRRYSCLQHGIWSENLARAVVHLLKVHHLGPAGVLSELDTADGLKTP